MIDGASWYQEGGGGIMLISVFPRTALQPLAQRGRYMCRCLSVVRPLRGVDSARGRPYTCPESIIY